MASSPSESKKQYDELMRKYDQVAKANYEAKSPLVFNKTREDGYCPGLVTPSDFIPSGLVTPSDFIASGLVTRRSDRKPFVLATPSDFLKPVKKILEETPEEAEKPKS